MSSNLLLIKRHEYNCSENGFLKETCFLVLVLAVLSHQQLSKCYTIGNNGC